MVIRRSPLLNVIRILSIRINDHSQVDLSPEGNLTIIPEWSAGVGLDEEVVEAVVDEGPD